MGKIIDWGELAKELPPEPAAIELERLKSYKTTKCQSMICVVCADPYPHLMTYRLFKCNSKTCAHAVPYLDCTWRGKLITCAKHKVASLFEFGKHHTSASSPKRSSMTSRQKEFCKSLTQQRLKPKRSHSWMRHQFNLSAEVMPPLRAVQNCVNYHARKTLGNNDFYDDITAFVREQFFTGYEEETKPFTFTWPVDNDGRPYVGDGGDAEPFFVGISTKQLLKRLDQSPEDFILHMDATFKLSLVEYPGFVVGISDRAACFHLVAVFVGSQRLTSIYTLALASLRRFYTAVTGKSLHLRFFMGDAEDAQYSAFADVLARDSSYTYLMCFFHMMQNVQKKIPADCRSEVLKIIYDIHFSNSEVEFMRHRDTAPMRWRDDPRTQAFSGYFEKQWLNDRYTNWHVYHTLSGYATTNNPVEQYNKVIKRDYTLHTRTKLGMLLRLLPDCCTDESMNQRPFHKTVKATDRLTRRARQMAQDNLLFEDNVHTTAPSFLAELQRGAVVNVFSAPPTNLCGE